MEICKDTKISAIIKYNPAAIDAISSINPHFKKLKNPVLRAVLAPRVTIADAAKIGKCSPDDFFKVLSPLGFVIQSEIKNNINHTSTNNMLDIESIKNTKIHVLDVRPILAQGVDPFTAIMQKLKDVPDGETLELVNTFEPIPLIRILSSKGYNTHVIHEGEIVKTYFLRNASTKEETKKNNFTLVKIGELNTVKSKLGLFNEIDVRDLEMPMPMVTILNKLEESPLPLFVHHKKIPQMLLPELSNRGYQVLGAELGDNDVKIFIFK